MSVVSPVPPPQSSTTWERVTQSNLKTRTVVIVVLALFSAIISDVVPGGLFSVAGGPSGLFFDPTIWVPGVAFGSVLAFALYQSGIRDKFHLGFVVLLTTGVWYAANSIGSQVYGMLNEIIKKPSGDAGTPDVWVVSHREDFNVLSAYLVGGFIGGLGTFLQTAFVAKPLRRADICFKMAAAGTISALAACAFAMLTTNSLGSFPLFSIWQVSIAVIVVRGLGEAPGFQTT
jgi:hypothetical protein